MASHQTGTKPTPNTDYLFYEQVMPGACGTPSGTLTCRDYNFMQNLRALQYNQSLFVLRVEQALQVPEIRQASTTQTS